MSEMLNRTWNYLSSNLNSSLSSSLGPRWSVPDADLGKSAHLPPSLATFIQAVYHCDTRFEEEKLVRDHLEQVEQRLKNPTIKPPAVADGLVRVMACHILGYDVSFAHIYALQLAQKGTILDKKMGYLACTLLLSETSDLTLLLINTIIKDLGSKNVVEINTALTAAVYLTPREVAPMIIPILLEKTTHSKEFIRKKALICIEKLLVQNPSVHTQLEARVHQCLSDPDPGVAGIAVQILVKIHSMKPICDLNLIPSLLQFQEQILSGKLPKEYVYGKMHAPWLQINILNLITVLVEKSAAADSPDVLDKIGRSVNNTMDQASFKETLGQAIIYECIGVIASLNRRRDTKVSGTSRAIAYVNKFLLSKQNNVKYMGLSGLECMLKTSPPELSSAQEENVFECLSHFDESIKRKTLSLIYSLANPKNVAVVCQKLIDHLKLATDPYLIEDLTAKVRDLAVKLRLSLDWYVSLMLNVLQFIPKGSQQREFVLQDVQAALSQIDSDDDDDEALKEEYRIQVGEKMLQSLKKCCDKNVSSDCPLPQTIVRLYIWALSEFKGEEDDEEALIVICRLGSLAQVKAKQNIPILTSCLYSIFGLYFFQKIGPECNLLVQNFLGKCSTMDCVPVISDLAREVSLLLSCLDVGTDTSNTYKKDSSGTVSDQALSFLDEEVVNSLEMKSSIPYVFKSRLVERARLVNSSSLTGLRMDSYQTMTQSLLVTDTMERTSADKGQSDSTTMLWSFDGRLKASSPSPPEPSVLDAPEKLVGTVPPAAGQQQTEDYWSNLDTLENWRD